MKRNNIRVIKSMEFSITGVKSIPYLFYFFMNMNNPN